VRGLFVVNPRATTTSPRIIDVIVHALSDEIDLDVTVTTHQGHGFALGERAVAEACDIVVTLGGDGIVNEVVNGLLSNGPGPHVPLLATVPGGSGNVFARSLGLPADAVEATGLLLELLRTGWARPIGLGRAEDRWFVANAGFGFDAEVIAAMEQQRRAGRTATPLRYLATTVEHYFRHTDRRDPPLSLVRGEERVEDVFLAIVQNTAPWTYLGTKPIDPCPQASFDTGLDLFAPRSLAIVHALGYVRRMLTRQRATYPFGGLLTLHDQSELTVAASRPTQLQIDGDSAGLATGVTFRSVPRALSVLV